MNATKQQTSSAEKPTLTGWLLFLLGMSFFLSAIPSLRPSLLGLSLHPYLGVLALLSCVVLFTRAPHKVSHSLGGWGGIFVVALLLSYLANGDLTGSLRDISKWLIMLATFSFVAIGVRNSADLRWGVIGLIFGVTLIGLRAMIIYQANPTVYLSPMPGIGSRNNYSLWAIAPFGLALWSYTQPFTSKRKRFFLLFCMFFMAVPLAMSLSRASVALLVLNAVLVFAIRRSLRMVMLITIVVLVAISVTEFFDFGIRIQERMNTLREGGTGSDHLRREIIEQGISIFIDNPIFGVSVHKLGGLLGRAVRGGGGLSSHNLFVDLLAGTGLLGFLSFMMCSLKLFGRWVKSRKAVISAWKDHAGYMPVLLPLIAIQGLTSNEVIFCPAIMMGLGLCFSAANHAISQETSEYQTERGYSPMKAEQVNPELVANVLR